MHEQNLPEYILQHPTDSKSYTIPSCLWIRKPWVVAWVKGQFWSSHPSQIPCSVTKQLDWEFCLCCHTFLAHTSHHDWHFHRLFTKIPMEQLLCVSYWIQWRNIDAVPEVMEHITEQGRQMLNNYKVSYWIVMIVIVRALKKQGKP